MDRSCQLLLITRLRFDWVMSCHIECWSLEVLMELESQVPKGSHTTASSLCDSDTFLLSYLICSHLPSETKKGLYN